MPIFKKKKMFLTINIIFQICSICLTSSCTLNSFHKNDDLNFQKARKQLKELIIPKGTHIPVQNEAYNIPDQDEDLDKKNYNILPPV